MKVQTRPVANAAASIVSDIYRPVWRGYLAAFALYYLVMLPAHFWGYEGLARITMIALAGSAAATGLWGVWRLRKPGQNASISALLLIMNSLIVLNIVVALNIIFAPAKLLYFLIIGVAFSLASSSFRQALISLALVAVGLISFADRAPPDLFATYSYLAFGATLAALSIAFLMRKALWQIATAKVQSEQELKSIESAKTEVETELASARETSEKMRARSLSDSLTGLQNRRSFFEKMNTCLAKVGQSASVTDRLRSYWVVLIDLDGFKAVNDTHGHLVGDRLLQGVAERLKSFENPDLFVCRMGGDEFNLILETSCGSEFVEGLCERLLDSLSQDYHIAGRRIKISGSIGCKEIDQLDEVRAHIRKADYVLRAAKSQGKNRFIIFDAEHAEQEDSRFRIETALKKADLSDELRLVFQPQHDLRTGRIASAEALLRWTNPDVGDIGPQRFIRIAEETGLICDLTLTVVRKAFSALRSWPEKVPLSINLSSHDVTSDTTVEQIIALAEAMEIEPDLVEFEVTETAMLADFEKANRNLGWLSKAGFSIALDDFGTGYSNFNYLRELPIQKLKIDRSFLENPGDPMSEKILFSLAGIARNLGMACLLEGVENEMDLLTAKRVGVEIVQGFHFGKPMSSKELLCAFNDQDAGPVGGVDADRVAAS